MIGAGDPADSGRLAKHTVRVIKLQLLVGLVTLCLWVYCLAEVIQTPEDRVRNLQKVVWLLLVLLFPFVGSVAWIVAGRSRSAARRESPYERRTTEFPEYDRPGRASAVDPGRDDEFLRQVRARAEEQRKRHEQARRERETGREGDGSA